ncbi:hypothetical protein BJV77DRAFT_533561 [Russula vinacea]|nr:hypothetical protein BJV77DRAFT_533561 [Russula vinacea]
MSSPLSSRLIFFPFATVIPALSLLFTRWCRPIRGASFMILCCDLPRGKFPYLVFNLVVFGHLVSSCVTQATLETRVCHSRVYFNSHPTPLLSFYLLLSTSPPAAFPSLSAQFTQFLPHVDAIAPSYQEIYNWPFTRCAPVLFSIT